MYGGDTYKRYIHDVMTKAGLPAFVVVSRVRYIEGFKDSRVTDVALARLIASFTAYMCPRGRLLAQRKKR